MLLLGNKQINNSTEITDESNPNKNTVNEDFDSNEVGIEINQDKGASEEDICENEEDICENEEDICENEEDKSEDEEDKSEDEENATEDEKASESEDEISASLPLNTENTSNKVSMSVI